MEFYNVYTTVYLLLCFVSVYAFSRKSLALKTEFRKYEIQKKEIRKRKNCC